YPLVTFGRELQRADIRDVVLQSSGGLEFVALRGGEPRRLSGTAGDELKRVRALALEQPEIVEACYRLPNPAGRDEAHQCSHEHPDWRFDHPRDGELVLVARPGQSFADPYSPRLLALRGDHGGPGQTSIPIVIAGGSPHLKSATIDANDGVPPAANPDLGAT